MVAKKGYIIMRKAPSSKNQAAQAMAQAMAQTAPSTTAPSTTAPSTTAPSTTAPSTTAPSTTGNILPGNVSVQQPPNGQTVVYGQTITVARKMYGGTYYGTLTPSNYTLVNNFTTAILKAITGTTAQVTPIKLSYQINNVHGTSTRIGIVSMHGQTAQAHVRFFTQAMFNYAHTNGITVYGNTIKGQTVNGQLVNVPVKAHSNHVILTAQNINHVVALFNLKAQSING
jgi:hypothetical protein